MTCGAPRLDDWGEISVELDRLAAAVDRGDEDAARSALVPLSPRDLRRQGAAAPGAQRLGAGGRGDQADERAAGRRCVVRRAAAGARLPHRRGTRPCRNSRAGSLRDRHRGGRLAHDTAPARGTIRFSRCGLLRHASSCGRRPADRRSRTLALVRPALEVARQVAGSAGEHTCRCPLSHQPGQRDADTRHDGPGDRLAPGGVRPSGIARRIGALPLPPRTLHGLAGSQGRAQPSSSAHRLPHVVLVDHRHGLHGPMCPRPPARSHRCGSVTIGPLVEPGAALMRVMDHGVAVSPPRARPHRSRRRGLPCSHGETPATSSWRLGALRQSADPLPGPAPILVAARLATLTGPRGLPPGV